MRSTLVTGLGLVAAAGGCGSGRPPPEAPAPSVTTTSTRDGMRTETRCELTPDAVRCHATNAGGDHTVACAEPFLGVKATGELLNGARRWCSEPIAPGATQRFDALAGVRPIDHCGPALDGCTLMMFEGDDAIAAFARQLEAAATRPTATQPSMQECDAARRAWLANPALAERYRSLRLEEADTVGVFCKLHLPRAQVVCFAGARTEADVEACVPDR